MENRITILEELQALSPLLASKRPWHPYEVPPEYFEKLPADILLQVSDASIPVSRQMPMNVPDGYFDGLAAAVLGKVKQSVQEETADPYSDVLAKIGKAMPYQVPAGYFEDLQESLGSVYWNESAPNLLTVISRKNPLTVPDGYFTQFPSGVLKLVRASEKPAAVFTIDFARKVYRYAAAAVIVGIVSVAALLYVRNGDGSSHPVAKTTTLDINTISVDELQNYLSGQELLEPENVMIATNGDLDAGDLKEFLDDMPEATLQKYVQDYAQPNTN